MAWWIASALVGGEGGGVGGVGDAGDDGFAGGLVCVSVCDVDGDGEVSAVGQGDEADVVGGFGLAVVLAAGAGFVGEGCARGEAGAEAVRAGLGGGHDLDEEGVGVGLEGRSCDKELEEAGGGGGLDPVAVLGQRVLVHFAFAGLELEAGGAEERADVGLDDGGATDDALQDLCGGVVALADGVLEEVAEGDVDVRVGVLVGEGAEGFGDAIGGEEAEGAIERDGNGFAGSLAGELAEVGEVEDGEAERVLEHGLHGWVVVRVQVAVEGGAGKEAGDGDGALGVLRDGGDLLLEGGRGCLSGLLFGRRRRRLRGWRGRGRACGEGRWRREVRAVAFRVPVDCCGCWQ